MPKTILEFSAEEEGGLAVSRFVREISGGSNKQNSVIISYGF
ncbi:hypothetical protein [Bartonella apis]|nr:hypothetical protein [Bartonella apis]